MAIESHPLRARLVGEMHLRRLPALAAPACMVQVVRLVSAEDRDAERAHILAMPDVPADARSIRERDANGRTPDQVELNWERHSEASTTTVIAPGCADDPFEPAAAAAFAWLEQAPGAVIQATKIAIVADEAAGAALAAGLPSGAAELVSCRVGATRLWCDFQIGADGYGRMVVAAGGALPGDLGRIVQRVQELGNYRNMALLGLPLAQSEGGKLGRLEERLRDIAGHIAGASAGTEAALLDDLCALSGEVVAMSTATSFRMGATEAYARITQDRLGALGSIDVPGFQSLEDFTERRMLPAVRTCASFVNRLEALSVRIERATSLLRTRVDIAMQSSNAELLRSMEANAARQLRLQHLVEGLSVVAVSYYAYSLLAKTFPLVRTWSGWPEEVLEAAPILPVIVAVALYLRWKRREAA